MAQTLLFLHFAGALVTGAFVLWGIVLVVRPASEHAGNAARAIALGAAYQLVTGSLLAIADPQGSSLLRFCTRIGLYVAIVVMTEGALFWRMKGVGIPFPAHLVTASAAVGMAFVLRVVRELL
ncbi:MAG: hypothetical protein Q8R32_00045 [bacterium]|nr:hypothetical protein [bacterium]